jgi:hypothetical protein
MAKNQIEQKEQRHHHETEIKRAQVFPQDVAWQNEWSHD